MLTLSNILILSSSIFILISILIALFSLVKERDIFVKLICLEVLSNVFVIGIGVFSLQKQMYFLLNVAIVVSLLIFLGTLAFCSLLEKRGVSNA